MIIFDTETSGLDLPDGADLEKQPEIIEFAAIRVEDDFLGSPDEVFLGSLERFFEGDELTPFKKIEFLSKPSLGPISKEITKITGLTNEDLADKGPFGSHIRDVQDFFLGERFLVAHNLAFDSKLLRLELSRIGMETQFPWPPRPICTVEASTPIEGKRMKLGHLYKTLFGEEMKGWHRAMADVKNTTRIVNELVNKGNIVL